MTEPILLTVATVVFQARDDFLTTLASVRAQTARAQIDFVVVDGASADGTVDEIQAAFDRGEVNRWVSEPDRGIYDAMNKAVGLARGEYTLFLNAGDVFPEASTVERLLAGGNDRPGLLWGDSEFVRGARIFLRKADQMPRFLYRQMSVCHQSLAVRTDLLKSHPFDLSLRVAADYAVLCALVTEGVTRAYLPLAVSRVQDEGFSSRNFFRGLNEKRQVSRVFFPRDQWRATPYFLVWGLYVWLKFFVKGKL